MSSSENAESLPASFEMSDLAERAYESQKQGELRKAADLWRQHLDQERGGPEEHVVYANYLYCLDKLDELDEMEAFISSFFKSIEWFPGDLPVVSSPEFQSGDVTAAQLASSLRTFGCALVRGELDQSRVADLLDKARLEAGSELREVFTFLPEAEIYSILTPLIREVVAAGRFSSAIEKDKSWYRVVHPRKPTSTVPFHQDTKAFSRRCMNVWVPLSPAGREAPGLELLPVLVDGLVAARGQGGSRYAQLRLEITEADLQASYPKTDLWHPEMKPGDVLFFLGTTVHRSYVTSAMTKPRRSLELRFLR